MELEGDPPVAVLAGAETPDAFYQRYVEPTFPRQIVRVNLNLGALALHNHRVQVILDRLETLVRWTEKACTWLKEAVRKIRQVFTAYLGACEVSYLEEACKKCDKVVARIDKVATRIKQVRDLVGQLSIPDLGTVAETASDIENTLFAVPASPEIIAVYQQYTEQFLRHVPAPKQRPRLTIVSNPAYPVGASSDSDY
jgi:hypothetical protein